MADVPCRVYFPWPKSRYNPTGEPKELTARTQAELEALVRIGWTTEKPKEGK